MFFICEVTAGLRCNVEIDNIALLISSILLVECITVTQTCGLSTACMRYV